MLSQREEVGAEDGKEKRKLRDVCMLDGYELKDKIVKGFGRYGVYIELRVAKEQEDRVLFVVKLKGKTREHSFLNVVSDVQQRLKCPLFLVQKIGLEICLIVSTKKPIYDHLPQILGRARSAAISKKMQLPGVVGYDIMGGTVIVDIEKFPHLLIGGSTNSGKTVGLRSLITSIAFFRSPNEVCFVLIDVGATDLLLFNGLPHLACPVIQDIDGAYQALVLLEEEMERRKTFEATDMGRFNRLPRIVIAIDEFSALFCVD